MANCQNNMRYGRQMNPNGCRNTMPVNNNSNCRNMPTNNNGCPAPTTMPDCQRRTPEPCGCHNPEPCECHKPEPCGCHKPEPCECHKPEPCGCHKPEPCGCHKPDSCGCHYDALEDFPIAMAYVPWQKWQNLYESCKGFQRGTIFKDLSKPFLGRGGCNR